MSFSRLGDRLLDLLVRRGDAGACVPNAGDRCYRYNTYCGGHMLYERTYRGTVPCGGGCTNLVLVEMTPIGKC